MSIFNHALISQRYFFPRPDAPSKVHWLQLKNVKLGCRLAINDDNAPLMVYFHGNGEVVADYESHIPFFHDMGVSVLFVEYRGYGCSQGQPEMAAMLDDVRELAEHLPVALEKCVAFGRSVGSLYAIEFASHFPQIAGLILESAIASPLERVLLRASPEELGVSFDDLQAEADHIFNHQKKMAKVSCPTLILHAKHDSLVSVENAKQLAQWSNAGPTLRVFDRGDHNSILYENQAAYQLACSSFLKDLVAD